MEKTHPEDTIHPVPELASIGIRKREEFALRILCAMLECEYTARLFDANPDWHIETHAVNYADGLIEALNGYR